MKNVVKIMAVLAALLCLSSAYATKRPKVRSKKANAGVSEVANRRIRTARERARARIREQERQLRRAERRQGRKGGYLFDEARLERSAHEFLDENGQGAYMRGKWASSKAGLARTDIGAAQPVKRAYTAPEMTNSQVLSQSELMSAPIIKPITNVKFDKADIWEIACSKVESPTYEQVLEDLSTYADFAKTQGSLVYLNDMTLWLERYARLQQGLYEVYELPVEKLPYYDRAGARRGEILHSNQVLVRSVDNPNEVAILPRVEVEFRVDPMRKPLSEEIFSIYKRPFASTQELWKEIGGKEDYFFKRDLEGDLVLYFSTDNPVIGEPIAQLKATPKGASNGAGDSYDVYAFPADKVYNRDLLSNTTEVYSKDTHVVLVKNKSNFRTLDKNESFNWKETSWNMYDPAIQILPRKMAEEKMKELKSLQ